MTRNRRRGRRARQETPPPASAIRPGLVGGRYRPLSAADENQVHRTILDVLENIGMADPIPVVKEAALQRGAFMNEYGRLCYPRGLVEDVIANTPRDIQFLGRDPKHDLEIGGQRVHTYGGGEAVNMLDIGASTYRPSTLPALYDAETPLGGKSRHVPGAPHAGLPGRLPHEARPHHEIRAGGDEEGSRLHPSRGGDAQGSEEAVPAR